MGIMKVAMIALIMVFLVVGCVGQQEPLVDDWRIFGCNNMTTMEILNAINNSECAGYALEEASVCNANTNTLWVDISLEKPGCNPACVVHTDTGEAEINWRCTGLVAE